MFKNFIKKIVAKILFWIDGVPFSVLEKIFQITEIFKKVIHNPAFDIVVELTKTNIDDEILYYIRTYIVQFVKTFGLTAEQVQHCQQVAEPDKRILCYLNTIIKATGKTPGEILKELFLWIADRKKLNVHASHLEIIHEAHK